MPTRPAQEPSPIFFRQAVVAFNGPRTTTPVPHSTMAWAHFNGLSFVACDAFDPPCNGGAAVDTSAISNFKDFVGHPTLVLDPRTGNAVYVTLADTDGDPSTAERVVASLSTDGGLTFQRAFPVNEDSCSNGVQDMPHAVFDATTSPATLWVVWRHNGAFGLGGSFGGCIRRFFVQGSGATAALMPLDEAHTIDGMDSEDSVSGQGGLKVAAGDGAVTVVYSKTDHVVACSDVKNANDSRRGVGWGSVTSFNNGKEFLNHITIFHSDEFAWCVFPHKHPTLQNSIRAFDFVRAPSGIEYVAINDSAGTVRLFMSPAAGAGGWQNETSEINTWFEFCPGTLTDPSDPRTPFANWRRVDDKQCPPGQLLVTQALTNGVALLPTLAVDGKGRLGLSVMRAADGKQSTLDALFFAATSLQAPIAKTALATFQVLLPPLVSAFGPPSNIAPNVGTVAQPLGAYMGMTSKSAGRAGCGSEGDFIPYWVQSDASGSPQIATSTITLSP